MDAIVKKICPNCSQVYNLKSLSPQPKGNIPLFLTCGHSTCETCIRNIIKFEEPIECKICHRDTEINPSELTSLSQNKSQFYKLFPVNMFMLGELISQTIQNPDVKKDVVEEYFIDLKAIIKSVENAQGQCIECHNSTSKMCQQCATILCDACFNKSHKNFVVFKNHVLQNIGPMMQATNCKVHKEKPLDYYCKDCSKLICMDCMMVGGDKSCKSHNVVSMQEMQEGFLDELTNIAPKVDENFRRLTKTAVDVGSLLYNMANESGSTSELTHMIESIEQHFSKLFATVQKHKDEVINIVTTLKCTEKESLCKAKKDIEESIKKSKQILNAINTISTPKKMKQANVALLLEEAKQIINTPWCLKRDETNKDPLKMVVNEDLCTLINDYIHLEGNANPAYQLLSTTELGESAEIPPPPVAPVFPPELLKDVRQTNKAKVEKNTKTPTFYKEVPKYRAKSGSTSSLNSLGSNESYKNYITPFYEGYQRVQPVMPFAESQLPKQLREGTQEVIYISHIVDPHNFYVQRACHQNLVKEMLREFRNAVSMPKPFLNHIAEGKVYLVYNRADNMWQRCRVVSIDRRDLNNPLFHVFCIDFGSTEVVNIEKLRLLPPARVQSPLPLAINCALANCQPKTGSWTNDDSILIQNIIDNKQAVIYVRQVISTSNFNVKLECDVVTFESGISLAHALVFHERARMPNSKLSYPKIMSLEEKPKLFISNNDFKLKSVEEVYITHIVSPDRFFVRKRHLQNVYEKLCEDLDVEYSLADNTGSVYLPTIGMVCVVNVEKCKKEASGPEGCGAWARALVTELPGRGRARVLLPDTGAVLLAHWTALRRIHNKFTTLRALATECHLAGVTPYNKKWSPGSVALLQRFEDRVVELHVEECARGSLAVTLYDKTDPEDPICINTEMIKYKFAVTIGLFMFNKNSAVEDHVYTNKSPLDVSKPQAKQKTVSSNERKQTSQNRNETQLEAKDKGPLRLEAKVLHYQSPSLLYVSLIHQQKTFNELYDNIQKYYTKNKTQSKGDWNVGDRCCTFCNQSKTWRRAVILELEEKNAKVFYSDFAFVETVLVSSLRELATEFMSIGDAAIKCHLCGVIPAVGEEWPSLSKEYLKDLLDAYPRIFITKLGSFKNKSMPVEIWVYHTIQGGALEPNVSEWRCLNKKIIEQGLGIPDKSQEGVETASANVDNDMLSFLNVTGSVRDWLQLESMPTKPLVIKSDRESNASTPIDYEDSNTKTNDTPNISNTVFISDWLPPEPLTTTEFTAVPTYVDNEGMIYLHDIAQQDTLDLIRKALDVRFKDPDPKAKYAKWTVGEPCIALYFLDNKFYRGRVLEVNNETSTCLIHYVDYGNEELCSFANLRKSIALYQIPIQAHKCFLNRIRPIDTHWDRTTLDYIHKSIVEKQCFVKITGEPIGGVIPIDLKYDKLWINDHLVDFEMAEYKDGTKAVVRKFLPITCDNKPAEETDSGPDYIIEDNETEGRSTPSQRYSDAVSPKNVDWNKWMEEEDQEEGCLKGTYVTYPDNTDKTEFLCNITVINDINTLELNIIHNDETALLYEEMFEDLQSNGADSKPLNGIFENKACISLFHEDGQWYRASILQYSEAKNQIKVRYVDYGNIEIVPLSDVREIREEWTKLPPVSMTVSLHGLKINPNVDIQAVTHEFSETFLDKGPFQAKIVSKDGPVPTVELRNADGQLIYEKLVENQVFIKYEPNEDS